MSLPGPVPIDLHFEGDAQESPDDDDQAQHTEALKRRCNCDCPDDVCGNQKLETQENAAPEIGPIGANGNISFACQTFPHKQRRRNNRGCDNDGDTHAFETSRDPVKDMDNGSPRFHRNTRFAKIARGRMFPQPDRPIYRLCLLEDKPEAQREHEGLRIAAILSGQSSSLAKLAHVAHSDVGREFPRDFVTGLKFKLDSA